MTKRISADIYLTKANISDLRQTVTWDRGIILMTIHSDCSGIPDGAWLIGVNTGAPTGEVAQLTNLSIFF